MRFGRLAALALTLGAVLGPQSADAGEGPADPGAPWARAQTAKTQDLIERTAGYRALRREADEVYARPSFSSFTAFPVVNLQGDRVYGFDRRGFHSVSWSRFLAGDTPDQPAFLMNELSKTEPGLWFPRPWDNLTCLPGQPERCFLTLSRGGLDRTYLREADMDAHTLAPAGFSLDESRSVFRPIGPDTGLVAPDLGPGSLTVAGFPRTVRLWRRGQPVEAATVVFESKPGDFSAVPLVAQDRGRRLAFIWRRIAPPDRGELYEYSDDGVTRRLPTPDRFDTIGVLGGSLILAAHSDWKLGTASARSGDVVAIDLDAARQGRTRGSIVFRPAAREGVVTNAVSLGAGVTKTAVYLTITGLQGARIVRIEPKRGRWVARTLPLPQGVATLQALDGAHDRGLLAWESLLEPPRLYAIEDGRLRTLRSNPPLFDAAGLVVERKHAKGLDGTPVPYWVVRPRSTPMNGSTPTILFGYGDFQVSELPQYLPLVGRLWLQHGGAFVIANVRGGGEFGPAWSAAGGGSNKQRCFDDFAAVAMAIERSGLADAKHLGARGLSAGGLLVATTALQHPGLFRAVTSVDGAVDLLTEGGSNAASSTSTEYGDLSLPEVRDAVRKYSPVEIVRRGPDQPEFLIVSHTNDQRVSASGSRLLHQRLQEAGAESWLFEAEQGDHGTAGPETVALEYAFFAKSLQLRVDNLKGGAGDE